MAFNRLQLLKIDSYAFSILIQCLWIYLRCSTEKLDVRLGYDLCREEQEFLQKRKRVVASALKRVFHLERDLHAHEVCELESKHGVWAYWIRIDATPHKPSSSFCMLTTNPLIWMATLLKFSEWHIPYSSKISAQLFRPSHPSIGQIPKVIIYLSSRPESPTMWCSVLTQNETLVHFVRWQTTRQTHNK